MKFIGKRMRWVAAVVAAVVVMMLGLSGTALAVGGGASMEIDGVGGAGSWTWHSASLTGVSLRVKDTSCDGNGVYISLVVYSTNGQFIGNEHWNENGCGTTALFSNLTYEGSVRISGAAVRVCVDDLGDDTCRTGPQAASPLW